MRWIAVEGPKPIQHFTVASCGAWSHCPAWVQSQRGGHDLWIKVLAVEAEKKDKSRKHGDKSSGKHLRDPPLADD